MNILRKTDFTFEPGKGISASQLQEMNSRINALIDNVNDLIMGTFDVNMETKNFDTIYTLSSAIDVVAEQRRQKGMKIRFRSDRDRYSEYVYLGSNLDSGSFRSTDNWVSAAVVDYIDGGEF